MADIIEREYVIPLRRHWFKVANYERTRRAVKAIKIFVAKHMKVADRDVDNVKLDVYFNNEMWFRGRANPPAKIKVKVKKENGVVLVKLAEDPAHIKFTRVKHAKIHSKSASPKAPAQVSEKKEEKTEEQKTEEKEKEKSVAEANLKEVKQEVNAAKHTTKVEKVQRPRRMALQK